MASFIGDLDLTRFRAFKTQSGQTKRALIAHFDLPEKVVDGWYRAEVSLKGQQPFRGSGLRDPPFYAPPNWHPANSGCQRCPGFD